MKLQFIEKLQHYAYSYDMIADRYRGKNINYECRCEARMLIGAVRHAYWDVREDQPVDKERLKRRCFQALHTFEQWHAELKPSGNRETLHDLNQEFKSLIKELDVGKVNWLKDGF